MDLQAGPRQSWRRVLKVDAEKRRRQKEKVAIAARSGRGGRCHPQQAWPVDHDEKRMEVVVVPCSEMQGTSGRRLQSGAM